MRDVVARQLIDAGMVDDLPTARRLATGVLSAMAQQPRMLADFAILAGAFHSAGFMNAKGTKVEGAALRLGDVPVYRRGDE